MSDSKQKNKQLTKLFLVKERLQFFLNSTDKQFIVADIKEEMNEKNTKKHKIIITTTSQSSETEEILTSFWTVLTQVKKQKK